MCCLASLGQSIIPVLNLMTKLCNLHHMGPKTGWCFSLKNPTVKINCFEPHNKQHSSLRKNKTEQTDLFFLLLEELGKPLNGFVSLHCIFFLRGELIILLLQLPQQVLFTQRNDVV